MIPKEFEYVSPDTLEGALTALKDGGEDAKLLAGGHSLIPTLKLRLAEPSLLVDLSRIKELQEVKSAAGTLEIGSMVTYHMLHSNQEIVTGCPLLAETALSIGDAQVRARGSIGGSLAHADPAADIPAAILALNSTIVTDKREIAAIDFFTDLFTTALEPGEIIKSIRVAKAGERTGSAYVKIRNKASHYAVVGVAAVISLDESGNCKEISLGVTGAGAKPFRLDQAEGSLRGTQLGEGDVSGALGNIGEMDVAWMSDLFGSEEYRQHLVGVVAGRAIATAKSRAKS